MVLTAVVVSLSLQLTAALYALTLIRITKRRIAWLAVSTALALMTVRRAIPVAGYLMGTAAGTGLAFELVGIVGFRSIFTALRDHDQLLERLKGTLRVRDDNGMIVDVVAPLS